MARLTTFSRLLITLAVLACIFFGIRHFFPQIGLGGDAPAPVSAPSPAAPESQTKTYAWGKNSGSFKPAPFNYTAPEPVGGKLRGVVELGATGFNSFIVRIDGQKRWKLEKAEFGASLVYENLVTDDDIKSGLKRYIADMLAFGVGARDIHFVISSGAKKIPATQKISAELKRMGYFVNEVTPAQEARLALKTALPSAFASKAFVVDIGSGNTKISWLPNGALEAPGAKYFQNNLQPEAVYNEVKSKAAQIPAQLRGVCFIIGGVPYELARQSRNGKERYTPLKAPGDYKADGAKQEAGLNIYRAIADATGCRQFVFDWDANFTIGFLLEL